MWCGRILCPLSENWRGCVCVYACVCIHECDVIKERNAVYIQWAVYWVLVPCLFSPQHNPVKWRLSSPSSISGKNKCQISWTAQGHVASEERIQDSIPDTLTHIHMLLQYCFTTASKQRTAWEGGSAGGKKDSEWLYLQHPAFSNILRNSLK